MDKIIKLNRRHIEQLSIIDLESEHQNSSKHLNKKTMKKEIQDRFDKGHEIFFGYKQGYELVGYVTLKPFFPATAVLAPDGKTKYITWQMPYKEPEIYRSSVTLTQRMIDSCSAN